MHDGEQDIAFIGVRSQHRQFPAQHQTEQVEPNNI